MMDDHCRNSFPAPELGRVYMASDFLAFEDLEVVLVKIPSSQVAIIVRVSVRLAASLGVGV